MKTTEQIITEEDVVAYLQQRRAALGLKAISLTVYDAIPPKEGEHNGVNARADFAAHLGGRCAFGNTLDEAYAAVSLKK